jgi:hypothetical protein
MEHCNNNPEIHHGACFHAICFFILCHYLVYFFSIYFVIVVIFVSPQSPSRCYHCMNFLKTCTTMLT